MEILQNLLMGFSVALTPVNLLYAAGGCLLGTLIGALPGIGSTSGVALLLPLTFGMNPTSAIIMLAGIYYGSMYGGTISSVLINTPGESATVVTTLDGYQMAKQGRGGVALGIAAIASFIAGTFGVFMLMVMAPSLAKMAIEFGPAEYFALMLLGLTTVTGLGSGSPLKAFISAVIGLLMATVGVDVMTGSSRFVFGQIDLLGGFDFLPIAIGLFGLSEILTAQDEADELRKSEIKIGSIREVFPSAADWAASRWAIVRGSAIGFFVGVLPGAGATIASFFSYAIEKKVSKHPEKFGTGMVEGVAGPEAANNAASAGAMVPLLTLGLPGSATTAVLAGAFIMWGLRPGPLLFQQSPDFVWGLIASMYVGNVLLVLINIFLIPLFVWALRVPYSILMPIIVILCIMGSYAANNRVWDVGLMVIFGVLGYYMKRFGYSPAALVLALVLGPLAERAFRQAMAISEGSYLTFFDFVNNPIAAILMVISLSAVFAPVVKWAFQRSTKTAGVDNAPSS